MSAELSEVMREIERGEIRCARRIKQGEECEVYHFEGQACDLYPHPDPRKRKWVSMWEVVNMIYTYIGDPSAYDLDSNVYLLKKEVDGKEHFRAVFYNETSKVLSIPVYRRGGSMITLSETVGSSIAWWHRFFKTRPNEFKTIDGIRYAVKDTILESN